MLASRAMASLAAYTGFVRLQSVLNVDPQKTIEWHSKQPRMPVSGSDVLYGRPIASIACWAAGRCDPPSQPYRLIARSESPVDGNVHDVQAVVSLHPKLLREKLKAELKIRRTDQPLRRKH